ncbi:MAG: FkbM family methyltransferase [Candidatus Aureabacteria bacterium]|nr:FkbM family methyltransferase [Candidatus Auribacterota bacterium]
MTRKGGSHSRGKGERAVREELRDILRESVSSVIARERSAFDSLAGPHRASLVLFGAGFIGRKVLAALRSKGITPLAFADTSREKWGTAVDGVPVLSPVEAAQRHGAHAAFIVTVWSNLNSFLEVKRQLMKLNCTRIVPFPALAWKYPDDFLPYYQLDLPHKIIGHSEEIIAAFDLLSDDESRRQYLAQFRYLLLLDFEGLPAPSPEEQYFPPDIVTLSPDEFFVDCGAFDGDTLGAFLLRAGSRFAGVIAYEPDPLSYAKLRAYASKLPEDIKRRITVKNAALGAARGVISFEGAGSTSSTASSRGSYEVGVVSLDEELSGISPTFIKFDIEGGERDAIRGAEKILRRGKPLIAISVYHNQRDIWEIPLHLHSLCPDYHFSLRSHRADGWETVLYAIPPERVRPLRVKVL